MRIQQLIRAEGASALLALVSVCPLVAAFRACPHDITVCKESVRFSVEILLALFLYELPFIIHLAEKLRSHFRMDPGRGPGIDVEVDTETFERLLDDRMVPVHHILRRTSLFPGLYGDRHPMLVRAADEQDILSPHPEIPHIYVRRDIDSGKMSDMHRTVGVRQSACHKCPTEIFVFHIYLPNLILIITLARFQTVISFNIRVCDSMSSPACARSSERDFNFLSILFTW